MANVSSAFGTITFRNKTKISEKVREAICQWAREYSLKGEYGIDFLDVNSTYTPTEFTVSFTGMGRWAFIHTIENPYILKGYCEREYENMLKALLESGTELLISFTDEECGFDVLYKAEGVLEVMKADGSMKTQFHKTMETTYEYTCKNLIDLAGYDCIMSVMESPEEAISWVRENNLGTAIADQKLLELIHAVCNKCTLFSGGYISDNEYETFLNHLECEIGTYSLNALGISKDYKLVDDNTAAGGISHTDETLSEFLKESNLSMDSKVSVVNFALKESGISIIC